MTDYRALQAQAEAKMAKADRIRQTASAAGRKITDAETTEIQNLDLEIASIELMAGGLRDLEHKELEAIVKNGTPVSGGSFSLGGAGVSDFRAWLKTGAEIRDASMSTSDANGGYIIPEPLHAAVWEKVRNEDPILAGAHQFDMTGGDATMTLPYKSAAGAVANATETGPRAETAAPEFTAPTLTAYDYFTNQYASQQFLDSSDAEDLLLGWIYEDLAEAAGVDAAVGDGVGKLKGLFKETDKYAVKLSGSAGVLTNTCFLTAFAALHPKYRKNAVWLMNSATLASVGNFASTATANQPLAIQNPNTGEWSLYGKPIVECTSAPDIGAANHPVAFVDLANAYACGVHHKPSILRDPFTVTPKVRFYGLIRMGGCAWQHSAGVLIKSNNA